MLISFALENWMSFRKSVKFSMLASRERQHNDRVPKLGKYRTRILPITAIYGGNASGKTNFFKALCFSKALVVKGIQPDSPIPVDPFRLDASSLDQPSKFSFELLINETIYEFSFIVTRKVVLEEKLVVVNSKSEKVLYHRKNEKINFDETLSRDTFLQFAFKGTRDNQLFLTNSVSQNIDQFRPVFDWFKNTLELVAPDTRFGSFTQLSQNEYPFASINEILPNLDIGIQHLRGEEIPFEHLPFTNSIKMRLKEEVREGMSVRIISEHNQKRFIVTCKNNQLKALKLVACHLKLDGTATQFETSQESHGSLYIIDLLTIFLELSDPNSQKVYIIDEIGRNLHTLLIRRLLEIYLASCEKSTRSQLLFSSHDLMLIDQKLLRTDEMWVTERDQTGTSDLFSFSEYQDASSDKDIRKSYFQGRFGGIPQIFLSDYLISSSQDKNLKRTTEVTEKTQIN